MSLKPERKAPSDDLLSSFMKKRDGRGNLFTSDAPQHIALNFVLAGRTPLLWPPAGDFKHVIQCDGLPDGTFVPAGSTMTYSIYSVGRMETVWGEACMEFRPERWLISPQGDRFNPSKDSFKFVAFNAGPRICLGEKVGLPTNEVCSLCCSALLPAFASSRTLGGAEDVSHSIHEERLSCLLAAVPTSIVDGQIWVIRFIHCVFDQ
ncbi:hypothetical protein V6N13_039490 [Hibiscus sabdariffa]|uniref:Cytochrome P450 n=1 Tax=Hibiscus sabdariffa TaxID=183260 RepID=A0ABR2SVX6_9ROSI